MEEYIRGYYPNSKEIELVDIFGYSVKGLPGVEIVGLGQMGKFIKEKIVYICKSNNLKFQLRRYVLCVDREVEIKDKSKILWLELPLLILFLTLTGHLKISKLHQFMAGGRIYVNNRISVLTLSDLNRLLNINLDDREESKFLLCDDSSNSAQCDKIISLNELLGAIGNFKFDLISTKEICHQSMGLSSN